MPSSRSAPSERRIAALLLIAVVAGAIGVYSYSQENPDVASSLSSKFKGLSFPTGFAIFSGGKTEVLTIDAELNFETRPEIEINVKEGAESLLISFNNPKNMFTIDRISWNYPSETSMALKKYTGKVVLSNPLSISGSAKSIAVTSAIIPESEKKISVSSEAFSADSVIFDGVSGINLELKNISGNLNANDGKNSAVYTLSNSMLPISQFTGDIEYYNEKIVLRGTGKIDTELLGKK